MLENSPQVHEVTGGVDTHVDTHTVAALDEVGRLLDCQTFPATVAGYTQLLGHATPGAAMRYQHAAADRDAEIARRLSQLVEPRDPQ